MGIWIEKYFSHKPEQGLLKGHMIKVKMLKQEYT
jgi:hypothetical protein